jgi:hypothetical protein
VPGRRLAADFLAALRPVAAVDRLPRAERFAFPRLVVVLARVAAAFFVVFLRLRGFSVPVTASTMFVAALDTPSMAASMLVLAASTIVPRTDVPCPSFSSSMLFTYLSVCPCQRHTESRQGSIAQKDRAVHTEGDVKASSVPRSCRGCFVRSPSVIRHVGVRNLLGLTC